MANQPGDVKRARTVYIFDVEAVPVPPGTRVRPKGISHMPEFVIPRSYWYLTAILVAAGLGLGLAVGRFVLP